MRLETLYERELNFINRLDEIGKFEYIEGYANIKSPVKVKHLKCGCECYMNAYTVAYSDIDMCSECGRQVRTFDKYKEKLEAINPDIEIEMRKPDKYGKCKYYVRCKKCNDIMLVSLDVLKEGNFKCCLDGVGAYKRLSKQKAKELYHKLKSEELELDSVELRDYIFGEIEDDSYFKNKGLIDEIRLSDVIAQYIEDRYKKDRVKTCSCCGKLKSGTVGWGRGNINYNSGICLECAKKSKKCSICGEEKRINSYSVENEVYSDVCQMCSTKLKKKNK